MTISKPITLRLISILLIFATLWIFGLAVATAQSFDAKVSFFYVPPAEDDSYHVGDQIRLRLEVRHPANSQVDLPMLPEGEPWGSFEIVSQTSAETARRGDNVAITRKDIVVTAFEPGEYQTPRILANHTFPDGSSEELAAPVVQLDIESILVDGDSELRDIKEQASLPVPPIWPWVILTLLIALPVAGLVAAGGFWLYHRLKRRGEIVEMPRPVPVDTRPPEVIAYAELDRIEAMNLPAKEQFKEHYILITECLRRYIEGRYRVPALERTTDELRQALAPKSTPIKDERRKFIDIFLESDLVKFARFRPRLEDAHEILNNARQLVQLTTPVPEPPVEETPEPETEKEMIV